MIRCVVLLRGVNVGRANRIAMPQLRAALAEVGCTDVVTYLQSGNAVFGFTGKSGDLSARIEKAIAAELGLDVKVILRAGDELAGVVAGNPFPEATSTPTLLHAMFLAATPEPSVLQDLDGAPFAPDEFRVGDRVLYLLFPNGMGHSKLPGYLSERRLGVAATTRNWNTVMKLLDLART